MPVNTDGELRGAEKMLERWEQGYELHADELVHTIEGLYEALRAALAARPQPDARLRSIVTDLACINSGHRTAVETLIERAREALAPARVGSATPIQEPRMMQGVWPAPAGDRTVALEDVAGSATPTTEPRMMQSVWPATAGNRAVAMEDVAGSATPTGDDG